MTFRRRTRKICAGHTTDQSRDELTGSYNGRIGGINYCTARFRNRQPEAALVNEERICNRYKLRLSGIMTLVPATFYAVSMISHTVLRVKHLMACYFTSDWFIHSSCLMTSAPRTVALLAIHHPLLRLRHRPLHPPSIVHLLELRPPVRILWRTMAMTMTKTKSPISPSVQRWSTSTRSTPAFLMRSTPD